MAGPEFALARERLMRMAGERRVAVMCAEAVWWRCHRRLIADDFIASGWQVCHLMAPGKSVVHELNADARMVDGVLRYTAPADDQQSLFDALPRTSARSEEHTHELQTQMHITYAFYCS